MSQEIFLIDANSLITPHLQFYPFDLAPGFWSQIEQHIENGSVKILDMVRAEILQGEETDELKLWIEGISVDVIDRREQKIYRNMQRLSNIYRAVPSISQVPLLNGHGERWLIRG